MCCNLLSEELLLANTDVISENIDCNEEERGVSQNHADGKRVIISINLPFYTDISNIGIIIYFLLDFEDGEPQPGNINRGCNKGDESGVAQNVDRSEGKRRK